MEKIEGWDPHPGRVFYQIYIPKGIASFFISLPEEEGVLNVDGVSRWGYRKDDLPNLCPKAGLELLI